MLSSKCPCLAAPPIVFNRGIGADCGGGGQNTPYHLNRPKGSSTSQTTSFPRSSGTRTPGHLILSRPRWPPLYIFAFRGRPAHARQMLYEDGRGLGIHRRTILSSSCNRSKAADIVGSEAAQVVLAPHTAKAGQPQSKGTTSGLLFSSRLGAGFSETAGPRATAVRR
jgi:hypothetical protein